LYRPEAFLQVPGGWGAGIRYWRGAWMAWMALMAWMAWMALAHSATQHFNDHLSTSTMLGAFLYIQESVISGKVLYITCHTSLWQHFES
jgi:arabinogalactan endo-1,4-beta-galactosidase